MKTNPPSFAQKLNRGEQIPQMKVRSDLRIGASLDTCEKSVEDWKRSYYKWYEAAKYKSV